MVPKATHEKRARSFDTGGFLFDEELTRGALALASEDVQTEEQASALFRDSAKGREAWSEQRALEDGQATFWTGDWKAAQDWLRRFLPRIAGAHDLAESSAAALARDISQAIAGVGIGEPRVSRRLGRYELTIYAQEDSVWRACIRAVLPFLPEYGWTRRLGQCSLKDCGRWFLRDIKPGTPEQYCDAKHAAVARIRRYRGKRA